MGRLEGKVALLAGGGGWIGSNTAKLFAREGASVVCADISQEKLDAVVNEITAAGGKAASIVTDVTNEDDCRKMVDFTVEKFGHLDILQNLATYSPGGDRNVVRTPNEVWDIVLKVNLYATVWGCRYAIPKMLERGGGAIINMASMTAFWGSPEQICYGTSKGAVMTMTKYIAASYGKRGIRCNAIAPGFSGNPGTGSREGGSAILDVFLDHNMVTRLGHAMDQANLALFLASDESAFINGLTIQCDGGMASLHPTSPGLRKAGAAFQTKKPAGGS